MFDAALELSQKLIAVESLTPTHPATTPKDAEKGLIALHHLMDHAQSAVAQRIHRFEGNDDKYPQAIDTLHSMWMSSTTGFRRVSVLYLGHVDVVPANPKEWKSPPFKPEIRDGNLYGRGAVDMKTPVACFYTAMEHFSATTQLPFEVHAVITNDEEYAAINGVDPVLRMLKQQGLEFDAVLVGEPSSLKEFADTYSIARRGSHNYKCVVKGRKGHMAYDEAINALTRARAVADAIEAIPFESHPDWKAQTKLQVRRIDTDSDSTSIVPGTAEIYFNIRFAGNYTPAQLLKMVEDALVPFYEQGWDLTLEPSQYPQAAYNGMPKGAPPTFVRALENAVVKHIGAKPQPTQNGGWSDGSHVQKYWPNIPVLEFGPLVHTMHQPDEHIPLEHIDVLCKILYSTLENYFRSFARPRMES